MNPFTMQCVILAAGEGRRMRPLTSRIPKVMLPIANRPILEHLLVRARDAGCDEFVLVVGYGEEAVRRHFGDGKVLGVPIEYAPQRRQQGTGDALRAAAGLLSERFLLLNGDALLATGEIRRIIALEPPVMAVHRSDHPSDYGSVKVEGGKILSLQEKTAAPEGDLVNAGAYLLEDRILPALSGLRPSPRGELELTDALQQYISRGELSAFELSAWHDIGYPWDMLDANAALLEDLRSELGGTMEEGVVLKGRVSIGRGTVVRSGTYIEGPCIIGEDCRIGPHAYIRGATSIGDRCHVGHCTEVKHSILMHDTNAPHFNYVGDSVVGSGCNLGAGTKIANLRHDRKEVKVRGIGTRRTKFGAILGEDVQLGINCSVNAGSIIGTGVRAAPGALLEGYYEEGSEVR